MSPPRPTRQPALLTAAEAARRVHPLRRRLRGGKPMRRAVSDWCGGVAAALACPLVTVTREDDHARLRIEATSHEGGLWAELMQVPERSDGTVLGHGPGAVALDLGAPFWMRVEDDGFLPWARAARQEGVGAAGARPVPTVAGRWLLQVYASSDALFRGPAWGALLGRCADDLGGFLDRWHAAAGAD